MVYVELFLSTRVRVIHVLDSNVGPYVLGQTVPYVPGS